MPDIVWHALSNLFVSGMKQKAITVLKNKSEMDVEMEKKFCLSEQEVKLLKIIRTVENGEIHIIVKERKPIRMEQIQKSIELD